MKLAWPWRARGSTEVMGRVVFTASDEDVTRMDVLRGPCASISGPRGRRGRPMARFADQWADGIETLETLSDVLTGDAATAALAVVGSAPPGTLYHLGAEFAAALAGLDTTARIDAVAAAWLERGSWPSGMQAGGLAHRLHADASSAGVAKQRGQSLYCWTGPLIEYGIIGGLPAWRRGP